jgi:hypothetical protein
LLLWQRNKQRMQWRLRPAAAVHQQQHALANNNTMANWCPHDTRFVLLQAMNEEMINSVKVINQAAA